MTGFKRAHEFSAEELERMDGITYHALVHLDGGDIDVRGYIKGDDIYTFCVTETKEHRGLIGRQFPLGKVSLGPQIFGISPTGYREAQG